MSHRGHSDILRTVRPAPPPRPWWRERELLLLALLVFGIYFTRVTALTIRGEETRWARVAREMVESGDWLVPRQQGTVYADRPPLGSWIIASTMWLTGDKQVVAVRLPSLLATLAISILIYGYIRVYVPPVAALAAGASYATMAQVLDFGRRAETEAVFTLFVAGALLVWHWGYSHGWKPIVYWTAGYALAAAATLTKGLQGPVYFVGPVFVYLVLTRDWRSLFSYANALGVLVFVGLIAAWQVPYAMAVDAEAIRRTWGEQAGARFDYRHPGLVLAHLVTYPVEIAGCLLPWSFLLIAYAYEPFRRSLGERRSVMTFMAVVLAVTFPTLWLAPGARGRYFMPLYPCFAVLVGLVIDRVLAARDHPLERRLWRRFLTGMCAVMVLAAVVVIGGTAFAPHSTFAQTWTFAAYYALAMIGVAALVWRVRGSTAAPSVRVAVLGVTFCLGLTYTGLATNVLAKMADRTDQQIAKLRRRLPEGAKLVSFELVHHTFRYHYGAPITYCKWPRDAVDVPKDVEYFCFDGPQHADPHLPFAWEKVAVVSTDRNHHDTPRDFTIIGRRVSKINEPTVGSTVNLPLR